MRQDYRLTTNFTLQPPATGPFAPSMPPAPPALAGIGVDPAIADAALLEYCRALARKPASASIQNRVGDMLACLGHADEAVASYRAALRMDPGLADVHRNLATAIQKRGDMAAALAGFARAFELQPEFPEAIGDRFARSIEAAYPWMHLRQVAGDAPAGFAIAPGDA